jgi:hypothetical protein
MRLSVLLLGVMILAGCADPAWHVGRPILWQAVPDAEKLTRETFECARDAKLMVPGTAGLAAETGGLVAPKDIVASLNVPQRRVFIQCMEAKGYQRAAEAR